MHRHLPLAVVLCVGLFLTAAAFLLAQKYYHAQERQAFVGRASHYVSSITRILTRRLDVIRAIGAFYAASDFVDRSEFGVFVKDFLARNPGIQALEWIPRVPARDRARYEERAREAGHKDFLITERGADGQLIPAVPRAEYFPVYYVEPLAGNEKAVGFDLASNPARLAALNTARDSGQVVATRRITLVQETGRQFGVLVFLPVYGRGAAPRTVDERRRAFTGFVLGVFRLGDFIEAGLKDAVGVEDAELYVFDSNADYDNRLLYHRLGSRHPQDGDDYAEPVNSPGEPYFSSSFSFAGRQWSFVFKPSPMAINSDRLIPWAVGVLGLLITAAFAWYLISSRVWAEQAERLVLKGQPTCGPGKASLPPTATGCRRKSPSARASSNRRWRRKRGSLLRRASSFPWPRTNSGRRWRSSTARPTVSSGGTAISTQRTSSAAPSRSGDRSSGCCT